MITDKIITIAKLKKRRVKVSLTLKIIIFISQSEKKKFNLTTS